jgi:hypothetical protein
VHHTAQLVARRLVRSSVAANAHARVIVWALLAGPAATHSHFFHPKLDLADHIAHLGSTG